jgi:acetyltransferase-like isoleucine patch superfamily enzyme
MRVAVDLRRRREITNSIIRSYMPAKHSKEIRAPDLPRGVVVGRHTYGYDEETFVIFTEGARIEVGAFCSIAPEVRILAGGEHVMTRISTFPFNARFFDRGKRNAPDAVRQGTTAIGNDVWIGLGATILAGVSVGDGAVIGARAVVSKSVPPYAVVVGNPGRILRYRFEPEIRDRLLALRWWEWEDSEIRAARRYFTGEVGTFLEEMERRRGATRPRSVT